MELKRILCISLVERFLGSKVLNFSILK